MSPSPPWNLQPDEYLTKLTALPPKSLRQRGFKAILLDLDDVVLPREGDQIPDDVNHWVERAKAAGLLIYLTSNNKFPRRVRKACEMLGAAGTSWAFKPLPFVFWRAMKLLKVQKKEVVVIGDQFFTDILGAKFLGLHSIFVRPMTPETRPDRKLMRWVERLFGIQ